MPALNLTYLFPVILWPLYGVTMFQYLFVSTRLYLSLPKCSVFLWALEWGRFPHSCFSQHGLCMCVYVCVRVFHKSQHQSEFLYLVFDFLLSFCTKTILNCKAVTLWRFWKISTRWRCNVVIEESTELLLLFLRKECGQSFMQLKRKHKFSWCPRWVYIYCAWSKTWQRSIDSHWDTWFLRKVLL